MSEWIYCKDRLPEESKTALICDVVGCIGIASTKTINGKLAWVDERGFMIPFVLAWMPFPELPEEVE